MEISEIQKAKSVGKLQQNEGVRQQTKIEDRLSISSESAKRAEWVEMLKEMSAIRSEKIETAFQSAPSSLELAHKMLSNE